MALELLDTTISLPPRMPEGFPQAEGVEICSTEGEKNGKDRIRDMALYGIHFRTYILHIYVIYLSIVISYSFYFNFIND